MKLKKFLSIACASVMVLSLAACAKGGASKSAASVDFEDGKFGFVLMNTDTKAADASVLSVKDLNGSKVLFAENQGNATTKIGVDLTALLGDDVAKLATIDFQLGTSADKFAACSGKILGNFGSQTNVDLGNFSVYMESKNPIDVSLKVSDLKAGEKNYIVINRVEDLGATPSSMFIDNIVLKDADGNVLKANTDGQFDAPEGYQVDWSQVTATVITLDSNYAGDWGLSTAITPEDLEQFTESGVKVRFDVRREQADDDRWALRPTTGMGADKWQSVESMLEKNLNDDGTWETTTNMVGGYDVSLPVEDDGVNPFFMQADGFFNLVAADCNYIEFTLDATTVKELVKEGGLAAQVYHVTVLTATLDKPAGDVTVNRDIEEGPAAPSNYLGAWGGVAMIEGEDAANYTGELTITLDVELYNDTKQPDTFKIVPIELTNWAKIGDYYAKTPVDQDGNELEVDGENFAVLTEGVTQVTFFMTADAMALVNSNFSENGWGGFGYQQCGVVVKSASVDGNVVYDNPATEGGADETPAPAPVETEVPVAADGTLVLSINPNFVAGDEYAQAWFQTYGVALTVDKVTATIGGEEKDVTDCGTFDGSDGNYTLYVTPDDKAPASVCENSDDIDKIEVISYYITLSSVDAADWAGGQIGSNTKAGGWAAAAEWSNSGDKAISLVLPN